MKRYITKTGLTRVYRDAGDDTDHRLLVSKLRCQRMRSTGPPKKDAKGRSKLSALKEWAKRTRDKGINNKM